MRTLPRYNMEVLMTLVEVGALSVLVVLVLDRVSTLTFPFLAPFLPDDVAGPGGWLHDTERGTGVFDN